jgi:NAD(P) transhydrogenase subunit alpha
MRIGSPRELLVEEARLAMTPDSALALQKLGYECAIEAGSDIVAKVRPPEKSEIARLSSNKTLISFFYPAQNKDLLEQAKEKGANIVAMDMVPRISRAQKMDALFVYLDFAD